jgi:hypothetical protein
MDWGSLNICLLLFLLIFDVISASANLSFVDTNFTLFNSLYTKPSVFNSCGLCYKAIWFKHGLTLFGMNLSWGKAGDFAEK